MASTGFTLATAGTSIDTGPSNNPWNNPGNITADDNVDATSAFGSLSTSDSLLAAGFGFSIPAGSTIDGIEVKYERWREEPGLGGPTPTSATVQLANAGSVIGDTKEDLTDWPDSRTVTTVGSSSDVWGAALTADIVNSATFGPRIFVVWPNALGTTETANVDYVQVNVHYTAPVGPPVGTLALMGCGR